METQTPKQSKADFKSSCMFCQDNEHHTHCCSELKGKSLDERRNFVKEKKLCFGCLKVGHNAKDCRHRLSCDSCKGNHPTLLHDDNYTKVKYNLLQHREVIQAQEEIIVTQKRQQPIVQSRQRLRGHAIALL